ncbi:helix-turn-helix domain-containing protein [Actinomadura chibensis]|uniref:Helix-turn-helix domain-containing protein n=1 Tax=Actinomadura chibensis TaxID=392828 RepID=A0A5D0NJD4_9ACTN|nr:helix-turn-helix domain-containing protein [Actinomadura chibensis]TYB44301.1 helix-turn-helix domain-containing protein [Actinomadura chibensis]
MTSDNQSMVRSLQRGLRLMNAVGEQGPVHAKQLARYTGVPLATVYHLLRTLLHDKYVVRLGDGSYVLGPALHAVGGGGARSAVAAVDANRCET